VDRHLGAREATHPRLCWASDPRPGPPTPAAATPKKRGPQPKIAHQLQQIEALPKAKQRAISQVLDSVIAAHQ
jgi:hypothetical protein